MQFSRQYLKRKSFHQHVFSRLFFIPPTGYATHGRRPSQYFVVARRLCSRWRNSEGQSTNLFCACRPFTFIFDVQFWCTRFERGGHHIGKLFLVLLILVGWAEPT